MVQNLTCCIVLHPVSTPHLLHMDNRVNEEATPASRLLADVAHVLCESCPEYIVGEEDDAFRHSLFAGWWITKRVEFTYLGG